jgi:hypothetical protein
MTSREIVTRTIDLKHPPRLPVLSVLEGWLEGKREMYWCTRHGARLTG